MGVDRILHTRVARLVIVVASFAVFLVVGAAFAQESGDPDAGQDRLIAEGRVVYESNCQSCHQPDGSGISGLFPPLLDNPAVSDTTYLRDVIANGREGELVVGGVTYNGVMQSFSALSEEQVDALVAYVQLGLGAPAPTPSEPTTPTAASPGLPLATVLAFTAGFGIFAVAAIAVGGPVALARRRRHTFTTVEVWLKVAVIVLYFVVATVFVPSWVVQSDFLSSPPSVYEGLFSADFWGIVRDLIGTGVWLAALVIGMWGLRWAQRKELI